VANLRTVGENVDEASARIPDSAASFEWAYVEMGAHRDRSVETRLGAEPYTLQLEAKTKRGTPAFLASLANSTAAAPLSRLA
jgi:hypothetical protein